MNANCIIKEYKVSVDNPSLPVFEPLVKVNGIKSSVDGQYISLNDLINNIPMKDFIFEYDFTPNRVNTLSHGLPQSTAILGVGGSSFRIMTYNYTELFEPVDGEGQHIPNVLTAGSRYKIVVNSLTDKFTINNTEYTWKHGTLSNYNFTAAAILASTISGSTVTAQSTAGAHTIHNVKFYKASTNELICNLESYKKEDGNGVLYDTVSHSKLYANSGNLVVVES